MVISCRSGDMGSRLRWMFYRVVDMATGLPIPGLIPYADDDIGQYVVIDWLDGQDRIVRDRPFRIEPLPADEILDVAFGIKDEAEAAGPGAHSLLIRTVIDAVKALPELEPLPAPGPESETLAEA